MFSVIISKRFYLHVCLHMLHVVLIFSVGEFWEKRKVLFMSYCAK